MKVDEAELISAIAGRVKRLKSFLEMGDIELILKETAKIHEYLDKLSKLVRDVK